MGRRNNGTRIRLLIAETDEKAATKEQREAGSNSAKNKSTNKSTNKTSNVSGSNKTSDKYQQ